MVFFQSLSSLFVTVTASIPELRRCHQERRQNVYSASAFLVTHWLLHLPQHFCFSALLVTLSYWLVGLVPSAVAFITACGVAGLTSMASESFFLSIATAMRKKDLTLTASLFLAFPAFLLNGGLPRWQALPEWLISLSVRSIFSVHPIQFINTASLNFCTQNFLVFFYSNQLFIL